MTTLVIGDSCAKFFSVVSKNYISVPGCTLYSINQRKSKTNCNSITFTEIKRRITPQIKNILLVYGMADLYSSYIKGINDTADIDKYVNYIVGQFVIFLNRLRKLNKNLLFLDILPFRKKNNNMLIIKNMCTVHECEYSNKKFNIWYKNVPVIKKKLMAGIRKHLGVISINTELDKLNNNKFYLGRLHEYPDHHIKHSVVAMLLNKYNLFTQQERKKNVISKFIQYDNFYYNRRKNWAYQYKYKPPTKEYRKAFYNKLKLIIKDQRGGTEETKKDYNEYKVGEIKKNHSGYSYDNVYYFRIAANDIVIQQTLKKGYLFEKYNVMITHSFIKKKDVIFDIGTNIGTMTIPFANAVGPSGKVYSFEPFPRTREYLKYNIKKNKLSNVIVNGVAVGHKDMKTSLSGTITNIESMGAHIEGIRGKVFRVSGKKVVEKTSSINARHNTNYGGVQLGVGGPRVDMITIDSLVRREKIKKLNMLKVDVEGAEPLVFWGARNTIKKFKPVIIFEYNWQVLTRDMIENMNVPANVQQFDIFAFCKKLGYDRIIESDREDYLMIPKGVKRVVDDPRVQWEKVNELTSLSEFNIKGYTLYKFIKPQW